MQHHMHTAGVCGLDSQQRPNTRQHVHSSHAGTACLLDCHSQFELDIGSAHFQTSDHMPRLHLMTFNLATGEASRQRVSSVVGDFPHFPQHMTGAQSACRCSMGLIMSEA